MSALPTVRTSPTGDEAAVDGEPVGQPVVDRLRRHEVHRGRRGRGGRRPEHRPRQHRLRRRNGRVGVAHRGPRDHAALDHRVRSDPEEGRLPQHQVGKLADLDRADLVVEAVRDRRADGVFRDVAAGPVVVRCAVALECAAAALHHVRGLPGAHHHLADAAHGLGVAADHRDGADVVQQILGGDGGRPDATLGEREILWDAGVQVMTHHQHVEVLVEGVDGVRPGRVRRTRQHIGLGGDGDDVRCVPAARALGVVGVDGAAADRAQRVLDETHLVEGVGVDVHLHAGRVGDRQARVDGCRGGAPVLVKLETRCAAAQLLPHRLGADGVALAEQRDVQRPGVQRLEHAGQMPGSRGHGGRLAALGRARCRRR